MGRPILLVEDDMDSRQMLALILQSRGHEVVTATNGMEAFNLACHHQPALILLDLMMPIMSGEEFRQAQLENATIKKIPVVVISAHHDAPRIAKRMKAAGCLRKPVDFDALLQMAGAMTQA